MPVSRKMTVITTKNQGGFQLHLATIVKKFSAKGLIEIIDLDCFKGFSGALNRLAIVRIGNFYYLTS